MIKIRYKTTRNSGHMRLPISALRLKVLAAVENKNKSSKQVLSKHFTKKYWSEITLNLFLFFAFLKNDCLIIWFSPVCRAIAIEESIFKIIFYRSEFWYLRNKLSYFQNDYLFKIKLWFHEPHNAGKRISQFPRF